jgi:uridine kinase
MSEEIRRDAVCLGVAGGSGSGKTTVAQAIVETVGKDRISYVAEDSYYRDVDWGVDAELEGYNFDHPDAFDSALLIDHLVALRGGRPVDVPIYDFVTHRRRELMDFKVFVDTEPDLRLIRRIERDVSERGRSLEGVIEQYLGSVRPMHLEFTEPSKRWADVIVPEGGLNRVAVDMVIARVRELAGVTAGLSRRR